MTIKDIARGNVKIQQFIDEIDKIALDDLKSRGSKRDQKNSMNAIVGALKNLRDEFKSLENNKDLTKNPSLESTQILESLLNYFPGGIAILKGPDLRYVSINQNLADLNGLPVENHIGKPLKEVLPDAEKKLLPVMRQIMKDGKAVLGREFRISLPKDPDKIIHLRDYLFPIPDKSGKPIGIGAIVLDISQSKVAEEGLKKSEKQFRAIFEFSPHALFIYDLKGILMDVNDTACRLHGYDREDLIGMNIYDLVPKEQKKEAKQNIQKLLRAESVLVEGYSLKKDGTQVDVEVRSVKIQYDEKPALLWEVGDISKRKEADAMLKQSKEKYRTLINSIPNVTWITDSKGNTSFVSDNVEKIYGFTPGEIYDAGSGAWSDRIHPDDQEMVQSAWELLFAGKSDYDVEFRIKRKDGKWIWINDRAISIKEEGDDRLAYRIFSDISERKIADLEVKQSEERFRRLSETTFEGICITRKGRVIDANKQQAEMFGYKIAEMIDLNVLDFVAPQSRDLVSKNLKEGYEMSFEHFAMKKNGEIFPVEVHGYAISYKGSSARITSVRDLSRQKLADRYIIESEQKYRDLFDKSRDAIYITSRAGQFLDFNQSALELLGYNKEEMSGLDVRKIYATPHDRIKFQKEIELKGYVADFELKLRKKDGTRLDCLVTSSVRLDREGGVRGYEGIIRNISDQRKAEEEIQVSHEQLRNLAAHLQFIREEERTRVARDIHDDLGQTLTVLGMDLRWVKKNMPSDNIKTTGKIDEMLELVGIASDTVQTISTELRPGLLDEIGLGAAMEWQISEFVKRTAIKCNFRQQLGDTEIEDDKSTAMFRIFQELLTNIQKHSRANKVSGSIKIANNFLLLHLKDNGVGLSKKKLSKKESYGIIGMRERVLPFEGEFNIEVQEGKGVTVDVKIPLL